MGGKSVKPLILIIAAIALCAPQVMAHCWQMGWTTYFEETAEGEPVPFITGDSIVGDVWSNDCISVDGQPVFNGQIHIGQQSGCDLDSAVLLGSSPIYGLSIPERNSLFLTETVRQNAADQGYFYTFPGQTVRAMFNRSSITFFRWPTGTPFDSSMVWAIHIGGNTCIFIDGPLEVKGVVEGRVTIGCSGNLRILDVIRYADANWPTGETPITSANILGLLSESDVIIANTSENGRENSGMPSGTWGSEQTNAARTDVVITAAIAAPNGSFTFEDQNDSASGYVCDCVPDDRGTIYVWGAIVQYRKGFLNRPNNLFTGYHLKLRHDPRMDVVTAPFLSDYTENLTCFRDDTLDFGDVVVGNSALDSCAWALACPLELIEMSVRPPFYVTGDSLSPFDFFSRIRFQPTDTLQYLDTLTVHTTQILDCSVIVRGRGVLPNGAESDLILHPSSLILSSFPNPFNARTRISFSLPSAGHVKLEFFDITGRSVRTLCDRAFASGEHSLSLDGSALTTGIYFVRLTAPSASRTRKIVLIK
ncbi:T9SS C-terminal target domain-containing protein [candidate division KSB1 bacterium]|nr:MAG: T9SS C-terminal target domain-containing protein [candidate division KSB1 bacterium]